MFLYGSNVGQTFLSAISLFGKVERVSRPVPRSTGLTWERA